MNERKKDLISNQPNNPLKPKTPRSVVDTTLFLCPEFLHPVKPWKSIKVYELQNTNKL